MRVRLTMVAETRRYHVALVDPLPAGLEALNPALATTGSLPDAGGDAGHGDRRARPRRLPAAPATGGGGRAPGTSTRTCATSASRRSPSLLWEGVHSYRYVARATTPGTFVVPPPKAEEMYSPETFGRGASDRVIVE